MELKPGANVEKEVIKKSSNRTFMELKQVVSSRWSDAASSSNRTFMELKLM